MLPEAAQEVFRYPKDLQRRRHGPRGYLRYESYKPWLRDEFRFRCTYCLCRERWFPDPGETAPCEVVSPGWQLPPARPRGCPPWFPRPSEGGW